MNTEEIRAEYRRNGFALGPKILDDNRIEWLRSELDRVIEERDTEGEIGPGGTKPVLLRDFSKEPGRTTWQIVDIWCASEAFRELAFDPAIAGLAASLADAPVLRIWHDQIQYKLASKGAETKWHQDSPAWAVLMPKDAQITAWIALDDVDESNGCMSMVPGSHTWGVQTDTLRAIERFNGLPRVFDGNPVEAVLRPVERGQVHFHHPLTWHGSHANSSDKPRRAIAIHYALEATHFVAAGEHVMKPHITVADGAQIKGDFFPVVWPGREA